MNINYQSYEEIPQIDKDYILTIAKINSITEVSLEEINGFLDMVNNYSESDYEVT